jgi:Ca2+-binding RTX toxin-like protein
MTANNGFGVYFDTHSQNSQLSNYHAVTGYWSAVHLGSHEDGGTIHNYDSIAGTVEGIEIHTLSGLLSLVTNAKGATINGGAYSIFDGLGDLNLINQGTLNGTLDCADGSAVDTILNYGRVNGSVYLYGAYDLFNSAKGRSGDIFIGSGHDNVLVGKGKTSIHIQGGNSTVTAGQGHDNFVFDGGFGLSVRIKHFSAADHIVLKETIFTGLGPLGHLNHAHFHIDGNAHNGLAQIVYNNHNGHLYYDSNGELPGGQTLIATLAGHPTIGLGTVLLEP